MVIVSHQDGQKNQLVADAYWLRHIMIAAMHEIIFDICPYRNNHLQFLNSDIVAHRVVA